MINTKMINTKMINTKMIKLIVGIILIILFSYQFYNNLTKASMDALINIFSIFAGFLFGIISLIGDPCLILSGSWQVAELSVDNIEKDLLTLKHLFYLYFITLMLIFLFKLFYTPETISLLKNSFLGEILLEYSNGFIKFFKFIILFLSSLAFVFSFYLPKKLISIQRKRIDIEIDKRMNTKNAEKKDDN